MKHWIFKNTPCEWLSKLVIKVCQIQNKQSYFNSLQGVPQIRLLNPLPNTSLYAHVWCANKITKKGL